MRRTAGIRRVIAWLSLVGYALVASGLPLPVAAVAPGGAGSAAEKLLAAKDRSKPFPCMDKPCGCATAEQCFSNCCCNTPAETLAWAKARSIDPAVIAALQRRVAALPKKTVGGSSCCSTEKTSCCSASSEPACCGKAEPVPAPVSLEGPEICSDYESLAAQGDHRHAPEADPVQAGESTDDEPVSSHTLVLKSMLACGGIVSQWSAIGGTLPPPAVEAVVSIAPRAEPILVGDDFFPCDRAMPDAPPPRVA